MLAPILYETEAFDAANEHVFQFAWSGQQMYGSKLTVRDNDGNAVVYTGTNTSMRQTFRLPGGAISNGVTYNAYIEILDANSEIVSDASETIVFACLTTPTFAFTDPVDGASLTNSSYTVTVGYTQEQSEILAQYQFLLYDSNKILIRSFGIQYATEYVTSVSQTLTALENNGNYFVRATGRTARGLEVDTDYVRFNVRYETPALFSKLDLVNDRLNGNIGITSNLIQVIGRAEPEEIYIGEDMIDARNATVTFDEGFEFKKDMALGASLCAITPNVPLLKWYDGENESRVVYREAVFEMNGDKNMGYFELLIDGPMGYTIIDSDFVSPVVNENTKRTLWVIKKNGYYKLAAVEETDADING